MRWVECALCGERFSGKARASTGRWQKLAWHVFAEHYELDLPTHSVRMVPCTGGFTCWCGHGCASTHALGQHLRHRGGMAAHLLEIALGKEG